MDWSEILNVVLGGGLVASVIGIVTIRSALKKARAEAERALAEADTVKITNTEQATRILIENIVEPLKQELYETRKELSALKREVARFRKAVDSANSCRYSDDCPVLERMRDTPKERDDSEGLVEERIVDAGQRECGVERQRKRVRRIKDGVCEGADVGGCSVDSVGQSPSSSPGCELPGP